MTGAGPDATNGLRIAATLRLTSVARPDATNGLRVLAALLVRDWLVFNEPKRRRCLSLFSDQMVYVFLLRYP